MSDESNSASPKKMRSPAYPLFGLGDAIKRARLLWDAQRKNDGHLDSVIHALGYAGPNGQSLRAVAALNHYGLTEETGAKDNRRIRLSEVAQDILHLPVEDDRRSKALKTAALAPAIHRVLWERYQSHPPGDGVLKGFLVREKSYGEAAAVDVISNYRESFELAKLSELTETDSDEEVIPEAPTAPKDLSSNAQRAEPLTNQPAIASHYSPQLSQVTQELPILVDNGQIARIPFPMSEDAYELLVGTLKLWKKKLVPSAPPELPKPSATIQRYPIPIEGLWKNKDYDKPVRIVALLKDEGKEDHYQTDEGTGIPTSQIEFP